MTKLGRKFQEAMQDPQLQAQLKSSQDAEATGEAGGEEEEEEEERTVLSLASNGEEAVCAGPPLRTSHLSAAGDELGAVCSVRRVSNANRVAAGGDASGPSTQFCLAQNRFVQRSLLAAPSLCATRVQAMLRASRHCWLRRVWT